MEEELRGSTMLDSFERMPGTGGTPGDIDVRLNLLQNLLDSHAYGLGQTGPASILLQQLGIALPTPPPMKEEEA
jgi:hypothetical protein